MGLLEALGRVGFLEGREPTLMHLLHSLKGCEKQEWRWDWDPDKVGECETKPLGVMLALEPNTLFRVWEDGKLHVITLGPGDVLLFEGDVLHAGADYPDACNTRVHLYLDVPALTRTPNSNWYPGASHGCWSK